MPVELAGQPGCHFHRNRAAQSDPKVGKAHRFAARLLEPSREQYLVWQRARTYIRKRIENKAGIKERKSIYLSQCDDRKSAEQNTRDHQTTQSEAVNNPSGGKTKERQHKRLAECTA